MIETARLRLIPATPALVRAELDGPEAFERAIGVTVPSNWPPDLYDRAATEYVLAALLAHPKAAGWWLYYVVLREDDRAVVVGAVGFKGPPDDEGIVEIGYGVLGQYRRRGIATDAARALIDSAFRHPNVKQVTAETFADLTPSLGVMAKCGFQYLGPGADEGVVRYGVARAEYERAVVAPS